MNEFNQQPLHISTFDRSDSPYHPTVLFFEDGGPLPSDNRFLMVQTPFSPKAKPYRDRFECPQAHLSKDGVHWSSAQAPILDLTEDQIADYDYFSDPHLVYGPDGQIECWFRHTKRHGCTSEKEHVCLVRSISTDGVNWSAPEYLHDSRNPGINPEGRGMLVSPAVLYLDGQYYMWYVDSEGSHDRKVRLAVSADGKLWYTDS